MASSHHTTTEGKYKRSLKPAECPICFKIPPDGIMLQCVNGHNVCVRCKRIHDGSFGPYGGRSCPRGGCNYTDPPTRIPIVRSTLAKFLKKNNYKPREVDCFWTGLGKESELEEYKCVVLSPSRPPIDTDLDGAMGQMHGAGAGAGAGAAGSNRADFPDMDDVGWRRCEDVDWTDED